MKRKIGCFLGICLSFYIFTSFNQVATATEFEGKEDEYTQKCQNTESLSKSDVQICKEFSEYLKDKNNDIENSINETQQKLSQTLEDVEASKAQLRQTEAQIQSLENELSVLEGNIQKLTNDITKKKNILRERMYILQTYMNGNQLVNLLLSSGNIDEFLTRIQCIDEMTNYDKDLISGFAKDKEALLIQKQDLAFRYDELFALKSQQSTLLMALNQTASDYQSSIDLNNSTLNNYREDVGYIDESLTEAEKRLQAEQDRQEAEEEAKKEEENNSGENNTPTPPPLPEIPSDIGNAIASTALTKEGCEYVYGGTGPNSFDCSGFAQWVYRQNGIYIPRTVTYQYYACNLVDNPEVGDLLFFNTTSFLGHVGIYLGNGQFIHAGTERTGVVIANFYSSYWQSVYQGAGRFR